MEGSITLTREHKLFLIKVLKDGKIDRDELRIALGIDNPVLNIEVISAGLPFAKNEDDIDHVQSI